MKRRILLALGLLPLFAAPGAPQAKGDAPFYPAALIPDSLKRNADAVVREETQQLWLKGPEEAVYRRKLAVTILRKPGDRLATLAVFYDRFRKITWLKGKVYDAAGKEIGRLKNDGLYDRSCASAADLFSEDRVRIAELSQGRYPYTAVFEYEMRYRGFVALPRWLPLGREKVAVERSTYTVAFPPDMPLRHRSFHCDREPEAGTENGLRTLTWTLENRPAFVPEPYSPPWRDFLPWAGVAADTFYYDGVRGNISDWERFGKCLYDLAAGRDELSPETAAQMRQTAKNAPDKRSVVDSVRVRLLKNTRYVSIQLGMGGYVPLPAATVDRTGYGDCKALSNYARALLKCCGIESRLTLIGASSLGSADPGFASFDQFNHMILCVPLEKGDTVWMDCTAPEIPTGMLPEGDADRRVLLLTETGGVLARTPLIPAEDNLQGRTARITVCREGGFSAQVVTRYYGYQAAGPVLLSRQPSETQKKEILENLRLSDVTLRHFGFRHETGENGPCLVETLSLEGPAYGTRSGNRLFLPVGFLNGGSNYVPVSKERKTDFYIPYGYHDLDSLTFRLPESLEIEVMPPEVRLNRDFGTYSLRFLRRGTELTVIRDIVLRKGSYPKERMKEFSDFYKAVTEADGAKVILLENRASGTDTAVGRP